MNVFNKKIIFIFAIFSLAAILIFILLLNKQGDDKIGSGDIKKTIISPPPPGSAVADQIILKYKSGISESEIKDHLARYNAVIIDRINAINRIVIKVPSGQRDKLLQELTDDKLVEIAEPNYINTIHFSPNDPSLNSQWGFINTGQDINGVPGIPNADIDADLGWDVSRGNRVKVAVIDTGIDDSHPDLAGKIVAQQSFVGGTPRDVYGHGTHVAGIVAAVTNNTVGVAGTCPECQIMVVKGMDDSGMGSDTGWINAIIWSVDNGAKVINMSFGSILNSSAKQDAVNYAWNKGVVLVATAGNSNNDVKQYPAANNNVISVASTDNRDRRSTFSSFGNWVSVAAPGSAILSTLPTYPSTIQQSKGQPLTYGYLSGTSMAAPMVAGLAGLLWSSQYGTSNSSVVDRILTTADKITGTGQFWIHGRINAGKALGDGNNPIATPTPTPTAQLISPTPTVSPSVPTPTSIYATPTLYCLGACITPTFTITPTTQPPTPPPFEASPTPVQTGFPTIQITTTPPLPTNPPVPPDQQDILSQIIAILLQFIAMILQIFRSLFGI